MAPGGEEWDTRVTPGRRPGVNPPRGLEDASTRSPQGVGLVRPPHVAHLATRAIDSPRACRRHHGRRSRSSGSLSRARPCPGSACRSRARAGEVPSGRRAQPVYPPCQVGMCAPYQPRAPDGACIPLGSRLLRRLAVTFSCSRDANLLGQPARAAPGPNPTLRPHIGPEWVDPGAVPRGKRRTYFRPPEILPYSTGANAAATILACSAWCAAG